MKSGEENFELLWRGVTERCLAWFDFYMVLRHNAAFGDLINDVTEIYK